MSRQVKVGNVLIGGGAPISIQSMTNSNTSDYHATYGQVSRLVEAGCDIVRIAVNNDSDVKTCAQLIKNVRVPLVADIQFDYKLAIACSDIGFAKVRFNPGNIGSDKNVNELVSACKTNGTPIRIGVNLGSIDKEVSSKYGFGVDALVESVKKHLILLERNSFYDVVLSAKSSSVSQTVETYRELYKLGYPLHVGVTESGYSQQGTIKSSIGIGSLLLDGIGDTIRVSLTGDPVNEVIVAKEILKAIGKTENYCEIVSCPTCSRCKFNLEEIVRELTNYTASVKKKIKIACMGCVVNGPGEARDADFGFAGGGKDEAVIFEKGKVVKKVKFSDVLLEIKRRVDEF